MRKRGSKGSALVLTIMISLILLTLTTAMSFYAVAEVKQTALQQKKLQAHYIARSGADLAVKWLTSMDSDQASDFANRSFPVSSAETLFGNGSFLITIEDDTDTFTVLSRGRVRDTSGFVEDTVSVVLNKASSGGAVDIEYAIFAANGITVKGSSASIKGDIGIKNGEINISGNPKLEGTIHIPPGTTPPNIGNKYDILFDMPPNKTYPEPDFESLLDPEHMPVLWDSINKNGDIIVDGDLYIEGDLTLKGNTTLVVNGNLYITGNIDKITGAKSNLEVTGVVYVLGDVVDVSVNSEIGGVIYAPNANVNIGDVKGPIVAKMVTVHGNSEVTNDDVELLDPISVGNSAVTFEMGYWK